MKDSQLFIFFLFFVLLQNLACVQTKKRVEKYQGVEQLRPLDDGTGELQIVPRSEWSNEGPMIFDIVPMKPIYRITVHHTAMQEDETIDPTESTKLRLQKILYLHKNHNQWADIGYHYIIDRAGVIWEGRDIKYQGAHAKGKNNEGNIGIALIGNFEINYPSESQKKSLVSLVKFLQEKYHVQSSEIYPHEHFRDTKCPGVHLISFVYELRDRLRN